MTEKRVLAELLVTTRGWDHPGWRDSFYPEDLPEAWQLAYFANSFAAVLLPASLIANLDVATIREWLAEIEGDFVFYLESDTSSDKLAAFAGRLAGILAESATPNVRTFEEDSNITLPNAPNSILFVSNDGEECFCLYRPSMELTMLELRVDMEAILAASKMAKRCVLCWDTKSPLAGVLENTKVIAELLGA